MGMVVPGEPVKEATGGKDKEKMKVEGGEKLKFPSKLWWKKKWYVWVPVAIVVVAIPVLTVLYFRWANSGDLPLLGPNPSDTVVEEPEPETFENPINGNLILATEAEALKENRPLCVMIENLPASRPQVGLKQADLVYEAMVEGGISRFMAVYWENDVEKLMPVRSARYVFVEWTTDIEGCVYYHIGEARSADPEVNVRSGINKYDVNVLANDYYSRDQACDRVKNTEHCAYTSTEKLWTVAKGRGWTGGIEDVQPYKFQSAEDTDAESHDIHLRLSAHDQVPSYQIVWTYDPDTNTYLRSHGTLSSMTPLEDAAVDEQVAPTTVAIIKTSYIFTGDDKNRNKVKVIGDGDANILMNGEIIEGSWEKASADARTTFYDEAGDEIVFPRGQIWIQAMLTRNTLNVKLADGTETEI